MFVAHALGAGVVVRPVRDVGERSAGVAPGLEVKPLLLCITVEKLLKCFLDLGAALRRRVPQFGEQIAILAGFVGTISLPRHAGSFPQGSIDVWYRGAVTRRSLGRWGRALGSGYPRE